MRSLISLLGGFSFLGRFSRFFGITFDSLM
jgi:hypothetical protein